jgi:hypothetical protein
VLERCRFATPDSEHRLIAWARRVMPATVRHKADVACAPSREEVVEVECARYLRYWFADEGTSLYLEGLMPADQGAVVAQALDRMAGRLPDIVADADDDAPPGCETSLEMRRADALYALASHRIACDADADRATVMVHAPLEALAGLGGGCEAEGGAVLNPDTARRLACDCPTWTTWCWSAASTIAWCTSTAGTYGWSPTEPQPGCVPTGVRSAPGCPWPRSHRRGFAGNCRARLLGVQLEVDGW